MMRALVVALCAGAGALELAVVSLAVPKASERYGAAGRAWRWKSAVLGDDMAFPRPRNARAVAEAVVACGGGAVAEAAALATCARLDVVVAGADGEAAAAAARACLAALVLRHGPGGDVRRALDRAGGDIAAAAAAGVPAGADAGDLDGAFATRATTRAAAEHLARVAAGADDGPGAFDPFSSRRAHVLKQVKACAGACATDGAAAVRGALDRALTCGKRARDRRQPAVAALAAARGDEGRRVACYGAARAHARDAGAAVVADAAARGAAADVAAARARLLAYADGLLPAGPARRAAAAAVNGALHGPTLALRRGDAVDEAAVRAAIDRAVADAAR